jgi:hypothetical protein
LVRGAEDAHLLCSSGFRRTFILLSSVLAPGLSE